MRYRTQLSSLAQALKLSALDSHRSRAPRLNHGVPVQVHPAVPGRLRDVRAHPCHLQHHAPQGLSQVHAHHQEHHLPDSARVGEGVRLPHAPDDGEQAVRRPGAHGHQALQRGAQLHPRPALLHADRGVKVAR